MYTIGNNNNTNNFNNADGDNDNDNYVHAYNTKKIVCLIDNVIHHNFTHFSKSLTFCT